MSNELTNEELEFIIYSLNETKKVFETYDRYPDENFRKERIAVADSIINKVKNLKS